LANHLRFGQPFSDEVLVRRSPASTPETARAAVNTDPSVDEIAMAARLRLSATRLARRLRQQTDTGLTPTQLSALAAVDRHGPLTLGDLAQHERIAPPTVTKVMAKLEADGLLTRQADPDDRRSTLVATTRSGRKLLDATRTRKDAWLAARIASLAPADQARLDQALDVLDELTGGEDA
jgi:DNA-binding MarR family transcriptional regulator